MLENSKFRNYDVNYVIIAYLLLACAFTNAKSHECTLENLDYYSTSVPRVHRTHNLRLAVVMLSTLLDKLVAKTKALMALPFKRLWLHACTTTRLLLSSLRLWAGPARFFVPGRVKYQLGTRSLRCRSESCLSCSSAIIAWYSATSRS